MSEMKRENTNDLFWHLKREKKFVKIDKFLCNISTWRELRFPAKKTCSVKIFWPALHAAFLNRKAPQPRLSNAPGGQEMD